VFDHACHSTEPRGRVRVRAEHNRAVAEEDGDGAPEHSVGEMRVRHAIHVDQVVVQRQVERGNGRGENGCGDIGLSIPNVLSSHSRIFRLILHKAVKRFFNLHEEFLLSEMYACICCFVETISYSDIHSIWISVLHRIEDSPTKTSFVNSVLIIPCLLGLSYVIRSLLVIAFRHILFI
jgi:hypothetical protein